MRRSEGERLRGLPPSIDGRARILVLGSFPSAASIAASCYYAHPRNQFWPILSIAWNEPCPEAPGERGEWALARGLALWDSLGACVRPGSLDGDISEAEPNDVPGLLRSWPAVERVLVNGTAAARYFRKAIESATAADGDIALSETGERDKARLLLGGSRTLAIFFLPSTSPVPSRDFRRIEDKLPRWLEALGGRYSPSPIDSASFMRSS